MCFGMGTVRKSSSLHLMIFKPAWKELACLRWLDIASSLPSYPGGVGTSSPPVRCRMIRIGLKDLATICGPPTAGQQMQFLWAAIKMRTSLPRMSQVVEPLQTMLEKSMSGAPRRTAKVVRKRKLTNHARANDRVRGWRAAQDTVTAAVTLYPPHPDLKFLYSLTRPVLVVAMFLLRFPGQSILVMFQLRT